MKNNNLNDEKLDKLSQNIRTKISQSQNQIYEINANQKNYRLRELEIQAVIDGLEYWLENNGFCDIEIHHLTKDIDTQKCYMVN